MATYCYTPRRHAPPATSTEPQLSDHHTNSEFPDLADSATYIFPRPSSAPPSPSRSPFLSDTSDISLSAVSFSNYGSPKNSPYFSTDGYFSEHSSPLQHRWSDGQGINWDLDNPPHLDSILLDADVHALGTHRTGTLNRRNPHIPIFTTEPRDITKFRHPLARTSPSPPLPDEDQPPIIRLPHPLPHSPIPLLSFFVSLLWIEDSTVDLVTSPPSSVPLPPSEAHTAEKLFSVIASENGSKAIRQGMRSLDECSVEELNLISFSGLWDIVAGLVLGGRKVLFGVSDRASEEPGKSFIS